MVRSRGRGSKGRTAAPPSPGGPSLFDLPCALLEMILLLLPLKLRVRFSATCRAAQQLVSGSPCLFPTVSANCRSRMQSLAVLRWLASCSRNTEWLMLTLSVQAVPIIRQFGQGIGMQGASLRYLDLSVCDGPLVFTGGWLSSLVQLQVLAVETCSIEFGSSCGQLTALKQLIVRCGWEGSCEEPHYWSYNLTTPATVAVQPGAISSGLTKICFHNCAMPELPAALCAAGGLKELRMEHCAVSFGYDDSTEAPVLGPTLGCLTSLETLQLQRMHLEMQESVAGQLTGLTNLRHLNLTEALLGDGGEQAVCSAFRQLSSLTFLSMGCGSSEGNLQAAPSSLPALHELRLVLPPQCNDQRLPVLAAAPHLQSLMVCGSTLLCAHNVQLLKTLTELRSLAVVLPHTDEMREQVDESGARRMIDAITSLPALEYVLLLFGGDKMEDNASFASIHPALEQNNLDVVGLRRCCPHHAGWPFWPRLGDLL